jgi:putative Holliday junction resolvase
MTKFQKLASGRQVLGDFAHRTGVYEPIHDCSSTKPTTQLPAEVEFLLGFDYGSKRIGIAVGQNLTKTASPIGQIDIDSTDAHWTKIQEYIQQWSPHILIVGHPLNMDESRGKMAKAAERFAEKLRQHFNLPVELIDERLSTREAKERLTALHKNKRWSKTELNSMAAQVILETYLNLVN